MNIINGDVKGLKKDIKILKCILRIKKSKNLCKKQLNIYRGDKMDLLILIISCIIFYQYSLIKIYKRESNDKDSIIKFKNGEIELLKHNLDNFNKIKE